MKEDSSVCTKSIHRVVQIVGLYVCVSACPVLAILVYHFACYLEYRCGIPDTARVVPVHGAW